MLREEGATLVAAAGAGTDRAAALVNAGAEVLSISKKGGGVDLEGLMRELGSREITSVLAEGGSDLLGSLFDARLVDKVVVFVAPIVVGGTAALGPVGGGGVGTIADALRLTGVTYEQKGNDMVVVGYPER
jgi:diaminohydroxyphosphoribosylaminopyrimidine deaminase/5-amino-6-(5-phosphoribosylamino)uracil reductase